MAKLQPTMGDNLTGVARARERCQAMLAGNDEFAPVPVLDEEPIATLRELYAKEGGPIGTIPPPASIEQLGKTAIGMVKPGSPTLFIDKLAARLAFERTGVRLYQALLSKLSAYGDGDDDSLRNGFERVLEQEFDHFAMLKQVIEEDLGGDSTAVTPSADVEATLSSGILAVMVDPRTNLVQSLEAIMIAELADNESWDDLITLSERQGNEEITAKFKQARIQEREHLEKVRAWIETARGLEG
jgi:rubrerythrin